MEKFIDWIAARKILFFIAGPVVLSIILLIIYLHNRNLISTDDAYIKAANFTINANVAGQVIEQHVKENQTVTAGELLFRIDPHPYQIAVNKAQAELANARLNVRGLEISYQEKTAEVQAAQDTLNYANKELVRHKKMQSAGLASQIELDKATHNAELAQQHFIATQKQQAYVLAQLNGDPTIAANQLPSVQVAMAALQQAKLNLSYTQIKAPTAGIVTKVESLQIGDYVQIGTPVFALISTHDVWVEANFKETQITNVHPGEKVTMTLDAYPDKTWLGHVDSISPGTGTVFSLLPSENATGNWVKIVQRVPIRIAFDDIDHPLLSSGLSVNVTVETKDISSEKSSNNVSSSHG